MTAFEASIMGVKSLLLCPTLNVGRENANMFSDLEGAGYVVKANPNANYIKEWVTSVDKANPLIFISTSKSNWEALLDELKEGEIF